MSKIYSNDTPVPFYENAKIVLHLIPVISFNPGQRYDIDKIADTPAKMMPLYCNSSNHRYNLDGFLTYSVGSGEKSHSYIQLFRNGIFEAVEGLLLKPHNEKLWIPSIAYEKEIIRGLIEGLNTLHLLGVEFPMFVFIAFVEVRGYSMVYGRLNRESAPIDRDVLLLPEILMDKFDVNIETIEKILQPVFDSIWNACGLAKSLNYNEDGQWKPKY